MQIIINGHIIETGENISLTELIENQQLRNDGIAIAVNDSIVPKGDWASTYLKNKDTLLIITATAGG